MISTGQALSVELLPFPGTEGSIVTDIKLTSEVRWRPPCFHFDFQIRGNLPSVQGLHGRFHNPGRKHELWNSTCLEAFISPSGEKQYLEINASPLGDWNLYHFDDYRQGMKVVLQTPHLNMRFRELDVETFNLHYEINLLYVPQFKALLTQAHQYRISVAAVVESIEGSKSYWAAAHAGQKPDFHLRESFVVKM